MGSITVGPFAFSASLLLLFASVAVALFVGNRIARKRGIELEPALWKILLAGALAARAAFVLTYLDTYAQSPLSIVDIRDGGFNPVAGIAAGLLLAGWYARRERAWRKPLLFSLLAGATVWGGVNAVTIALQDSAVRMPQMEMTRLDGSSLQLDTLRGKPVVVNLWATWCPPCRREMPVLQDAQLREKDVDFVFVNQGESADMIRKYLDSEGLVLANVLLDPTGELGRRTGSRGMPTTLFFDARGRLVDSRMGELSAATLAHRIESLRSSR
jgi:thiol-disulfide isomerase/thioredoxin